MAGRGGIRLPARSTACTSKVCEPSIQPGVAVRRGAGGEPAAVELTLEAALPSGLLELEGWRGFPTGIIRLNINRCFRRGGIDRPGVAGWGGIRVPARSTACTSKVCAPSLEPGKPYGEVQAENPLLSNWHSNAALTSGLLNSNDGESSPLGSSG